MNKGQIKYMVTSSNTKAGFFSFIPYLIKGIENVYILKGPAGSGKSTLIRLLGESVMEQGFGVEFWMSAIDPLNPEGVFMPQLDVAVVNGSLPNPVDPCYPGGIGEIVNLGDYIDKVAARLQRPDIERLIAAVAEHSNQGYYWLEQASLVREGLKRATARHLDRDKLGQLVNDLAHNIVGEALRVKHYFASVLTSDGMINLIDNLSADCQKRYILKGPEGSGKSGVIEAVAGLFQDKGYVVEFYHNGLDAQSVDMVIIREVKLALIDGGNGAWKVKPGDMVIDMTLLFNNHIVELTDILINEARRDYEAALLAAKVSLDDMGASIRSLKRIYAAMLDFTELDAKRGELLANIVARGGG